MHGLVSRTCRSTGLQEVKDTVKQFDWTYTTRYQGTVFGGQQSSLEVSVLTLREVVTVPALACAGV